MTFIIQCESGEFRVPDISEIRQFVDNLVSNCGDAAYWLREDGEFVAAFFFNGKYASVFRYADGAEPFNPDAPAEEKAYFRLENGQLDEFYLSKCIDYDTALDAFTEIAISNTLSPHVNWLK